MTDVDTCCRKFDCPHLDKEEDDRNEPRRHRDWCRYLNDNCTNATACSVLGRILRERNKPDSNAPIRRMRSMNMSGGTVTLTPIKSSTDSGDWNSSDIWEYVCPWCDAAYYDRKDVVHHMEHVCKKKPEEE